MLKYSFPVCNLLESISFHKNLKSKRQYRHGWINFPIMDIFIMITNTKNQYKSNVFPLMNIFHNYLIILFCTCLSNKHLSIFLSFNVLRSVSLTFVCLSSSVTVLQSVYSCDVAFCAMKNIR